MERIWIRDVINKELQEVLRICYLKNKKWILTYDVAPEIFQMYNTFRNEKYYLNYSVTKPSKGIEYIFYSNNLIIPQDTRHLKKA